MKKYISMLEVAFEYPKHDGDHYVRRIAHGMKARNREALREAAESVAAFTPGGAILVPIPGRHGFATTALEFALAIQEQGCWVGIGNILYSNPRASQYRAKKHGQCLTVEQLAMRAREHTFDSKSIILIDNVVDTGNTLAAARKALGFDAPAIAFAKT